MPCINLANFGISYRLLHLYAEENATQDAIYYLGEGLRRGVLDLDVFLKVIYFLHGIATPKDNWLTSVSI